MNQIEVYEEHLPANSDTPIEVSASTVDRARRSMPEGTQRAYAGDLSQFLKWARSRGLPVNPPIKIEGQPRDVYAEGAAFAPLAERRDMPLILAEYVNKLCDDDLAPASIERAMGAIGWAYKTAAAGNKLGMDGARAILRTHRSDRAARPGARQRRAAAVTPDELRRMLDTLDVDTPRGSRDRAILVLGLAMGCRRSELAALDIADLTFGDDDLEVYVRKSKTDRDSKGRAVMVLYGNDPNTCPIRTVRAWLAVLAEHGRTGGALFIQIDRHGNLGRSEHPRKNGTECLTGQSVATVINRAARAAGLDPSALWSGHSLRRGFATVAYSRGADPLRIARHGGWRDGSKSLAVYVEDVDRKTKNPLIGFGL